MMHNKDIAQELYLLHCSLLFGEILSFQEPESPTKENWNDYLEQYPDLSVDEDYPALSTPHFTITTEDARCRIDVQYLTEQSSKVVASVAIKGDITRVEQAWWQRFVEQKAQEVKGNEFATYELISTYLLPELHNNWSRQPNNGHPTSVINIAQSRKPSVRNANEPNAAYHALLTSHHLISPTKRKNLQQWSWQLHVSGFAKVGYPGCIYCEGEQEQVEEFVANVKAMQWLALRVRFVEPLPKNLVPQSMEKRRWVELEKVGEVLEEMRRLGRESFVVEMGIGSVGQRS